MTIRIFPLLLIVFGATSVASAQAPASGSSTPGRDLTAWHALIDAARVDADGPIPDRLDDIPLLFAEQPARVIELAERLGAAGASEQAATAALRWLTALRAAGAVHVRRELARARVLAGRGHHGAALGIVAPLAEQDGAPEMLRLYAQLLAATERYGDSLDAYERYLRVRQDDRDARLEQARVAGRAQQYERAARLYAEITRRYPADRVARAEADAKRLFYAAQWREAEDAYARLLALEPSNDEAAFEYAETLVAQRRIPEARHAYARLSSRAAFYEVAHLAQRTLDEGAGVSAGVGTTFNSASGYGGQRQLEWSETSARLVVPVLHDADRMIHASAGAATFSNGALRLRAYSVRGGGASAHRWGSVNGAVGYLRGARSLSYWHGRAEATLGVAPPLSLRVGADRTPILDNLSTVRDGVISSGVALTMLLTRPDTEASVGTRVGFVGSNRERSYVATVRQRVHRGTDTVHVVGGLSHTGWREDDVRFYSPARLARVDAGAEWTRWLRAPRFRLDGRSSLMMRYQIGVDSDGEWYHQPQSRLSVEHRRFAIDAEAAVVSSRVYRSVTLRLGVRIGG